MTGALERNAQAQIQFNRAQYAGTQQIAGQISSLNRQYQLTTRVLGGLRAGGGVVEGVAGAALVTGGAATSEFGIGIPIAAGGAILIVHAKDQIQAGVRQASSGSVTQSNTERAIVKAGFSPNVAATLDGGISMIGTMGATTLINGVRVSAATAPRLMAAEGAGARFAYDAGVGRYRSIETGRFVAARDLP